MKKYETKDFKVEVGTSTKEGARDKCYVLINKDSGLVEWDNQFLVSMLDLMLSAQEDLDALREKLRPKPKSVDKGSKGNAGNLH